MRVLRGLFLIGASLAAFGQSEFSKQTVAPKPEFTLEITANLNKEHSTLWDFENCAQTVANSGSMVVVAIRKTNITDHEIIKRTHPNDYYGYYFDVHDSNGEQVALNHPNNVVYTGDGRGGHLVGANDKVLQPGESKIEHVAVSDIWDISKPGIYTFQVLAHVSDDPKSDVVKSNIITVTVLPKPESDDPK